MISVVGAGPAGCMAAKYCSKKDDAFLYEGQRSDSRRIQCSGLVSKSGFARLGISLSSHKAKRFVIGQVRGAKIYSPGGRLLEIDGRTEKAIVLDRPAFDSFLLDEALDSGARFISKRVAKEEIKKVVDGSERTILATGTDYSLHRFLGLGMPKRFLYGAQYEMRLDLDHEFVEMYLDVPGFFSWVIPAGDVARIGLCANSNPAPFLESFIKKLSKEKRLLDGRILSRQYGIIPIYDPKMRTQYERISLVGDAAGQVKATTGGGIVMGGLAAKHCSEESYESLWRKEIARELFIHLQVRNLLDRLSPKNTDRLISLLQDKRDLIEEEGDMDYASGLIKGLLLDPVFLAKLLLQSPFFLLDII